MNTSVALNKQPISSLIAVDDTARFRNDVQLSLFDDPEENLALLQSYIFTVAAPGATGGAATRVASVTLLEQIVETFLHANPAQNDDNRIFALANFGHGKSHLALAMTNYFAKPVKSREVDIVLEKLDHAINEPARSAKFHTFKENRGEFLVIRLRGDVPIPLSEQFYAGLDHALHEHTATAGLVAPVWHTYAESILITLTDAEIERADAALALHGHDMPTLLAAVRDRKDVRKYCIEALTAARGMVPNLMAQSSLKDTIGWAVKELCGEGKPLGGVLVLFDEFSFFVNRYGRQGVSGELQDLLNGISDHPRHAVFLSFGQYDPQTVADNAALSIHARDSLKQELTRIPKKVALYSLMESVIDAYVRQRDFAWNAFATFPDVKTALDWATMIAHHAFAARYNTELRWDTDRFASVVTKGSFPLHPLTTALLCNLHFSAGDGVSDPRTVLGFVLKQVQAKLEHSLMNDLGAINWVMPVELVDYFEQRISPEVHVQYNNARRNLTHDASESQHRVLKALYLYQAAGILLSPQDQIDFIVEAVGPGSASIDKSRQAVINTLAALGERSIRQDQVTKLYSFWPSSVDFVGGEKLVGDKMAKASFTAETLRLLNNKLLENGYRDLSVDVPWGNPEDWAARQEVMIRSNFNTTEIKRLAQPYQLNNRYQIEDSARGAVLWLVAKDEDDVAWFRANAAEVIDRALAKDAPPPVVAILPAEPTPGLFIAFLRLEVLLGLTTSERAKVGSEAFDQMLRDSTQSARNELTRLIGASNQYVATSRQRVTFVAAQALRANLSTLPFYSLQKVLESVYKTAYRLAPRLFFKQYRAATQGNNNLRNAVKQVASILLEAKPETLSVALNSNPVARELRDKYLIQGWGVLTQLCAIKAPMEPGLKHGWDYLDQAFPIGGAEERVAKHLLVLLNAPYGYDYNTLTLLFASWFAHHHHDLAVYAQGRTVGIALLQDQLAKGPKDFLQALCGVHTIAIARRDPDRTRKEVKALIATKIFSLLEAESALAVLQPFANNEHNQAQERTAAQAKVTQLNTEIEAARTYATRAQEIILQARQSTDVPKLVEELNGLGGLPKSLLVKADAPEEHLLRTALVARLSEVVKLQCQHWEKPSDTSLVGLHRDKLSELRVATDSAGLPELIAQVDGALAALDQQSNALVRGQQEGVYLQRIHAVSLTSNLVTLREAQGELAGYTIQTPEIERERDAKVAQLAHVVKELERFAAELPVRCDEVNSRHAVDKLRDEIMKQQGRFVSSQHEQLLAEKLTHLDSLRVFFDELDDFKRDLPQSPTDEARVMRRFEALANQVENGLSEVQRTMLHGIQQMIQTHVAKSQERARQWLKQNIEQARTGANPTHVAQQLSKVPPFFPEDLREDLHKVRLEMQMCIDNDAILKVEQAFRAIGGRQKQEECLQRLAQILQNTGAERMRVS